MMTNITMPIISEKERAQDDSTAKTLGEWWAMKDMASTTPDR
jgi:hypothetical protein